MLNILEVRRELVEPAHPAAEPPAGVPLTDRVSGLVVRPGEILCLVSALPDEASALADRLGGFDRHGTRCCSATSGSPTCRSRSCAAGSSSARPIPSSSPGRCASELDPWGRASGDAEILAALAVANGEDILEALPEGLDAPVEERGRSFSGGQRQRLVLARALLSDAEILVLVEPTSAVDAHTEARIADRLQRGRAGPHDRDRHLEPAGARPRRPRRPPARRPSRRRGPAPAAPVRQHALPRDRHTR